MYWLAAGSFRLFGVHDWAGRLPLALLILALLLATYALGLRLFAGISPAAHPDRAALYSALALATCIGPYLYTRFYIPDIVVALWMTLAVHAFLVALERIKSTDNRQRNWQLVSPPLPRLRRRHRPQPPHQGLHRPRLPARLRLLLPALTRQLRLLPKFHLIPSTLVFLAIAAPWHILAALRNPPIAHARRPRSARPRRLGLVLSLQRAHRPLPLRAASLTTTARSPSRSSGCSPPSGSFPGLRSFPAPSRTTSAPSASPQRTK